MQVLADGWTKLMDDTLLKILEIPPQFYEISREEQISAGNYISCLVEAKRCRDLPSERSAHRVFLFSFDDSALATEERIKGVLDFYKWHPASMIHLLAVGASHGVETEEGPIVAPHVIMQSDVEIPNMRREFRRRMPVLMSYGGSRAIIWEKAEHCLQPRYRFIGIPWDAS